MQSKGESHEDFLFYHSTIDSAFMTRVSAVPAYLSYGPSKAPMLRYVPKC